MAPFAKWFASRAGRSFVRTSVTTLTGAVIVYKIVPQTILIDKYTDIFYLYKSGFKSELSHDVKEKFDKCKELLNISDMYRDNISCFPVFGFDLFHAGFFDSKFGAAIGVPKLFSYVSESDIDKELIQVNLRPVDWSSEVGKQLADSLILTENEKLFGICREILMTNTSQVYLETLYPTGIIYCTYLMNTSINQNLLLLQQPLVLRLMIYTLTGILGLGMYFLTKDLTQCHFESSVDEKLCELGPDFVEAGIGFYTKLLNRNKALRELIGEQGDGLFNKLGNEIGLWRTQHLPLTLRKQYFVEKVKLASGEITQEML